MSKITDPFDTPATLRGGELASATTIDGRTIQVGIRQVPIRDFEQLLAAYDSPQRAVEIAAGKKEGWADTLTDDSIYALHAIVRRLHDPRLGRWLDARKSIYSSLGAQTAAAAGALSPASSPAPSPASVSPGMQSPA